MNACDEFREEEEQNVLAHWAARLALRRQQASMFLPVSAAHQCWHAVFRLRSILSRHLV